ncbi:hypothetical protein PR202_ga22776 [Eleusine coracana subsp. coracana]|uniref:Uncharacterized protein n=1 Tax=Eleusine coracana subsp. coracana TaxID=191504 RepID=A0AAV5D4T5_ELECO|nr:hypothetical protein PR202_ga22776 [Eleusine coracana subsp. coracana]
MGMLPSKLLELLKKEYQLQKGVREDVKFLSRELESMYTALRKVAMVPWEQLDDQVKVWAREVREASYEMEDVLDTFIIRAGSGPEPAHMVQRLMKKMGKLFDLSKVMARRDIAAAIEGIKLQLQEMSDRRDRYKVDGIVVHPSAAANVDPRLSHLYIKESQLVGIDEPREELIKMLSIQPDSHISDGKEMKIVSVVGLGGLGKTTLAKAVYDKVNLQFDCRAFIPVGQNPDPRKVLRDILIDIENNNKTNIIFDIEKTRSALVDLMQLDERQLINELREHLKGKRKISVPKWIGKLTSLVELEMYHEVFDSYDEEPFSVVGPEMYHGVGNKCSTRQFVKELGKLTKLRVLMTGMTLQDEEQGREFLESLRKLHKIQSINISLPNGFLPMDVNKMEPKFVLSSNLRVLDLFNLQFSKLPAWINAQNLPNLCHLTVVVFDEDEQDLAVLGKFIRLRKLALAVIRVHRLKLAACGSVGFQNLTSFEVTVPLKFAHGAMPSLEYINFSIPVAELKDVGINLEFGLENLSSLRSVHVNIDCADACEMEVNDAEAVLKNAMDIHPNHPACEVKKTGENKMGPADALSRMENRQCHKIVKASTLSADINVQQELHNALYNEAADVARSMPKEHPCVAKLALLPKNLAGDPVGSLDRACELLAMDQLIEKMETQERLLEEYNVEIPRMATILEELKTALSLQVEDDGVRKICDLLPRVSPAPAANRKD